MNVYVLFDDNDDDRWVIGVYATEELAERASEDYWNKTHHILMPYMGRPDIEKWEVLSESTGF